MSKKYALLYALFLVLFFFCAAPGFVMRSMYNDGIWYAILSQNISEGLGSFWNPQLTATIFPSFHEHPPLVFGIQSLFFDLFGSSIATERIYAFFIFSLTTLLIVTLWKKAFASNANLRLLWPVPLILWIANEVVYLFYAGNILEPTMGLFTLLATYLLLYAVNSTSNKKVIFYITLAGIAVIGASLSKGFVGLFPLAVLGIHWLIFRKWTFSKMLLGSCLLLAVLLLGYWIILANPVAADSLQQYIDSQVMASIKAERTSYHHRDSRFYILKRLIEVSIPAIIVLGIALYFSFKKSPKDFNLPTFKVGYFFLLIGISASFPLMISPKQSFYYLVPALPFFALAMGAFIAPIVHIALERMTTKYQQRLQWGFDILLVGAFVFSLSKIGAVSTRERVSVTDIEKIGSIVPGGSTLGAKAYTAQLVGYLYRNYKISIDTTQQFNYPYLIIDNTKHSAPEGDTFEAIDLDTQRFDLYRKK